MAEIYEIDRNVLAPVTEDGELIGIVLAEIVVESEGEQLCLFASYDGCSSISLGANPRSEMWFYYKTEPTPEDEIELDLIRQGEIEGFLTDDEDIMDSEYVDYYRELVQMIIKKALETGISTEEELEEYKF